MPVDYCAAILLCGNVFSLPGCLHRVTEAGEVFREYTTVLLS